MSVTGSGYLVDSHAVLWYLGDSSKLSADARSVFDAPANRVLVSDVTLYELMFKAARARLPIGLLRLPEMLSAAALPTMPISTEAIRLAATLDWPHGDPWDRLLFAQAALADLVLVSKDEVFDAVGNRRLW